MKSCSFCAIVLILILLCHSVQYLLMTRWISYLLHGEYLLFIARWISEAPCVISWLSHDSRDVISTWWHQIWRRCGPYGLYGTVWYDFILRLYCIVGPNLYDLSYADMAWIFRPILWFLLLCLKSWLATSYVWEVLTRIFGFLIRVMLFPAYFGFSYDFR